MVPDWLFLNLSENLNMVMYFIQRLNPTRNQSYLNLLSVQCPCSLFEDLNDFELLNRHF